jgi:hypothetical protein
MYYADDDDRGGASDGLDSDAAGNIHSTNYEHKAILRRRPDREWETALMAGQSLAGSERVSLRHGCG